MNSAWPTNLQILRWILVKANIGSFLTLFALTRAWTQILDRDTVFGDDNFSIFKDQL